MCGRVHQLSGRPCASISEVISTAWASSSSCFFSSTLLMSSPPALPAPLSLSLRLFSQVWSSSSQSQAALISSSQLLWRRLPCLLAGDISQRWQNDNRSFLAWKRTQTLSPWWILYYSDSCCLLSHSGRQRNSLSDNSVIFYFSQLLAVWESQRKTK